MDYQFHRGSKEVFLLLGQYRQMEEDQYQELSRTQ